MLNKKFFLLLLCSSIIAVSCIHDMDGLTKPQISSPLANWTYYDDTDIFLSSSYKGSNLVWTSSIDGTLGQGDQFAVRLSAGTHVIKLTDGESLLSDEVQINIRHREQASMLCRLITEFPFKPDVFGCTKCGLINLEGEISSIKTVSAEDETADNPAGAAKLFSLRSETKRLVPFVKKKTQARSAGSTDMREKTFYIIDTANQFNEPAKKTFKKHFEDNDISAWIPSDFTEDTALIDECLVECSGVILKRVKSLWGRCADVDGNGRLTILFCPSINQEKKAIGFFNSVDFFSRNTDKSSPSYNPYSNEGDIIYVGIPSASDRTYSVKSICATIAHELTHAVNFTGKTWNRYFEGRENAEREETFLDEGWSHLTESLCGYGVSGGNSDFINFYLENTAHYSLCGPDYLGQSDSVEQRGAVCLFLYYLFNRAGGIAYDAEGNFINCGGISFLRAMTASETFGWKCIGEYFGKSTDSLFLEYAKLLFSEGIDAIVDECKKDPLTKENIIDAKAAFEYDLGESFEVLPKSIVFYKECPNGETVFDAEKYKGTVYFIAK